MFHVEPALVAAGISVPPGFADRARIHLEEVYRWNKVHDLTAVAPQDAVERHLVDSLLPFVGMKPVGTVLDVGTGAGFPGIPLALWWPGSAVTLCEPLRKRRSFLDTVCARLDLTCTLESKPVEQLEDEWDLVTSRATLPWKTLMTACWPRLRAGGTLVALTGPEQSPHSGDLVTGMPWSQVDVKRYALPSGAPRTCIVAKR